MDDAQEQAEFERMMLHQQIEHARLLIGQYKSGLAHYRNDIEQKHYRLGRIDEQLGDVS